jgi:2-polyprenyl-3-methyl-5-hydroxy-6-metoxy-1,4-benzoquinol methylase
LRRHRQVTTIRDLAQRRDRLEALFEKRARSSDSLHLVAAHAGPTRDEAKRYYADFSRAVGLRDWLKPNPRHEQLKLLIRELLHDRRELKLADIGCGAGVMTAALRRYGEVTAIDFSGPAIEVAQRLVPDVRFLEGSLEALPEDTRFDVITLFDVIEHIPAHERGHFLAEVRTRLADQGMVVISTPFPAFTRFRRANNDPTLQIVDEEVWLPDLLTETAALGLQLLEYRAFDVFRGSPEYQAAVFTTKRTPGGGPVLRQYRLSRRLRWIESRIGGRASRVRQAAALAARGRLRDARWMLSADVPTVES